ncbi:putative hemerythrin-like protein [Penicillium oxalicum]|uniref:putative hemerythrin-like protein n=1 Tax=Penicillium oxalicum TaxID=69781 RepID=UPI0020B7A6E8|nr:putative hemerythrin-like protein [Penicillium oxalicum]KAI2788163.1 putative hemerythrin-like protein [Penicillium oxalicum]
MAPRIINAVTADHRQIEDCYSKVLSSPHNDEKTWWQNLFTWELARHSIDEELVICPRFEKKVPEGRAMAEEHRREHQSASKTLTKVKEQLRQFQDMIPTNPQFEPTHKALVQDPLQHIHEEKNDDLPKLEGSLSPEDSESLAKSLGRTKMFVPSRSHPSAPIGPP